MDSITAEISQLEISPSSRSYAKQYHNIVSYACEIRRQSPSKAELDVTKALAGPFITGGLLVILLEPLQTHPWLEGSKAKCATLSALEEGISVSSGGKLSLCNHVSVLDLRPFICKELNNNIGDHQREKLLALVLEAINAKMPDVTLCMGNVSTLYPSYHYHIEHKLTRVKEPRRALMDHKDHLSDEFRKRNTWIYAMHPSRSVNHNPNDLEMRLELLESIHGACKQLDPGIVRPLPSIVANHLGQGIELFNPSDNGKDGWVKTLLCVLVNLCLRPPYQLPDSCLMANSMFRLERWHQDYFDHILKHSDTIGKEDKRIAATLVPLLRRLNMCFKSTSWYTYTYEIDWEKFTRALADGLTVLEDVCGSLGKNRFSSNARGVYIESSPTKITTDTLEARRIYFAAHGSLGACGVPKH
ncbi:hypothetical protein N7494_005422 [Penicillium frequentans]|uniref:Uncharacterized protein n=1 Tax=Penicillium frequentans TaxID=3151616 RepID=A0AAD6GFE5_9EURO|nr:hypothetical protein N7494_005422 [Penicillium glabrum]